MHNFFVCFQIGKKNQLLNKVEGLPQQAKRGTLFFLIIQSTVQKKKKYLITMLFKIREKTLLLFCLFMIDIKKIHMSMLYVLMNMKSLILTISLILSVDQEDIVQKYY